MSLIDELFKLGTSILKPYFHLETKNENSFINDVITCSQFQPIQKCRRK